MQYFLPAYTVLALFPRLISLPYFGLRIQLTELLFLVVLLFCWRNIAESVRRFPLFALAGSTYVVVNLLAGLSSGVPLSFLEAGGRAYLFLVALWAGSRDSQHDIAWTMTRSWWKQVTIGLSIIAILLYLIAAITQWNPFRWVTFFDQYPYFGNVYRLRGSAMVYGTFCMLLLPGALFTWEDFRRGKKKWWPALLIFITCGLTLGKEIVLLAIGIILLSNLIIGRLPKYLIVGAATCFLLFATHFLILSPESELRKTAYVSDREVMIGEEYAVVETNYTENKRAAIIVGQRNPWLGVGPGQYAEATTTLVSEGKYPARFGRFDPHSAWTGAFAETGGLGLMSLFLLVASLWYYRPAALEVLSILLLLYLLASTFKDVMNFRPLWLLIGLYLSSNSSRLAD